MVKKRTKTPHSHPLCGDRPKNVWQRRSTHRLLASYGCCPQVSLREILPRCGAPIAEQQDFFSAQCLQDFHEPLSNEGKRYRPILVFDIVPGNRRATVRAGYMTDVVVENIEGCERSLWMRLVSDPQELLGMALSLNSMIRTLQNIAVTELTARYYRSA